MIPYSRQTPRQPYFYIDDPLLGWGARSEGGVEAHEINANHHEVLREPHVQFASKVLLARLHPKENQTLEPALSARRPMLRSQLPASSWQESSR